MLQTKGPVSNIESALMANEFFAEIDSQLHPRQKHCARQKFWPVHLAFLHAKCPNIP
jgi:hypothetical protein